MREPGAIARLSPFGVCIGLFCAVRAFPVQTESSGQIRNAEYRDFELFTVSVKL